MSQNLQTIDNTSNNWIPQPSTNIFKTPHIIECSPLQGQGGDSFRIDIQQQDLSVNINLLKVAFHSCITACQFSLNTVTQVFSIHAQVPNSNLINFDLSKVPIYLVVIQEQTVIDSWIVGYFSYLYKKRPLSSDNTNETKRPRSDELSFTNYYVPIPYIGLPPTHPSPKIDEYFKDLGDPSITTTTFNEPEFTLAGPSVLATEQEPSYIIPVVDPQSSSPLKPIRPLQPLSTLEPSANPSSPLTNNPFTHLVYKPNLILRGDLFSMTLNWTETERRNKRRVVQFWRRQEGNDIICHFEPFFRHPIGATEILVSCIYWQNEYYVTSVDCIALLERLIGVKFTIEEKNRIRRNLEEYRPMTVSKATALDFFRLIMEFPAPRPRNIEKGVKVFPWRILSVALTKIITKYTASYSSTASVTE